MFPRLLVKDLRYTLNSLLLWLMAGYVAVETYSKGSEFFHRAKVNVMFASSAEEWGYRISCFPLYLYMLIAAVLIHYSFNRDERYGLRSLVFTKEISAQGIVLSRPLGIVIALCVAYTAGILAGTVTFGVMSGYYPTPSAFFYGLCLNTYPALFVWSTIIVCLSILLGDLKVLVFPVVLVWFLGQIFPGVSLVLSHTKLAVILSSGLVENPSFFWHLARMLGGSLLFLGLSVRFFGLQRIGLGFQNSKTGTKRSNKELSRKEHRLISSLWLARIVYDFKVALGRKIIGGIIGSVALPFLIFGPFSPASKISSSGNTYFVIAFSELFLPLIGLLVSSGTLDLEDRISLRDVIVVMPGGRTGLLRQKLVAIVSYFASVLVVYVLTLKVLVPHIAMLSTGLILGASMLFVCVLAMCISFVTGHPSIGYGVSGILVMSGLLMEEKFPWFVSPVYALAEYTIKLGVDRLVLNKILLVIYSIAGLVFVMHKLHSGTTRRGETY